MHVDEAAGGWAGTSTPENWAGPAEGTPASPAAVQNVSFEAGNQFGPRDSMGFEAQRRTEREKGQAAHRFPAVARAARPRAAIPNCLCSDIPVTPPSLIDFLRSLCPSSASNREVEDHRLMLQCPKEGQEPLSAESSAENGKGRQICLFFSFLHST